MLADLFERAGLATIEAEAELEDLLLPGVEGRQQPADLVGEQRTAADSNGVAAPRSGTRSPSSASPSSRSGDGERQRFGGVQQGLGDLRLGHVELGGELGQRGGTAELHLEAGPGLLHAVHGVAGVHREPDGAAGVGDATGEGLADPPGGVRRELEALAPVELLDGVDQAEVAFLNEVEERQARRLVLLGDRHDQPEVGLDERALGGLTLADELAELTLAGGGEALSGLFQLDWAALPASMA